MGGGDPSRVPQQLGVIATAKRRQCLGGSHRRHRGRKKLTRVGLDGLPLVSDGCEVGRWFGLWLRDRLRLGLTHRRGG